MIRLMEEQFKTFGLEITAKVEEAVKAAGVEMEFVTLEWHPAEKILGFAEKMQLSGMQRSRHLSCTEKDLAKVREFRVFSSQS